MARPDTVNEVILDVLRPYASNWSGTLGRGDLVIPQRDIPRVVHAIIAALRDSGLQRREVTEAELFQALTEARRQPSVQDEVSHLLRQFIILRR